MWSSKVQWPFVLHFTEPVEANLHLHVSLNVCFHIILPRLNFLRNVSLISGRKFCMYFSCFGPSYTSGFSCSTDIQRRNVTYEGPRSVIFSVLFLLTPQHCSSKRTQTLLTISYSKWPYFMSVSRSVLASDLLFYSPGSLRCQYFESLGSLSNAWGSRSEIPGKF